MQRRQRRWDALQKRSTSYYKKSISKANHGVLIEKRDRIQDFQYAFSKTI